MRNGAGSAFLSTSEVVAAKLDQARRAAYAAAMRAQGRGDEVGRFRSEDWERPLADAEDCIAQEPSRRGISQEEQGLLWSRYGLVRLYIDDVLVGPAATKWADWLFTPAGIRARAMFPQAEYDAKLKGVRAFQRLITPASPARLPRLRLIAATLAPPPQRAASNAPEAAPNTHPEDDALQAFARSMGNAHGLKWRDHRPKGGALWIEHLRENDGLAKSIGSSGFQFKPGRGWWRK